MSRIESCVIVSVEFQRDGKPQIEEANVHCFIETDQGLLEQLNEKLKKYLEKEMEEGWLQNCIIVESNILQLDYLMNERWKILVFNSRALPETKQTLVDILNAGTRAKEVNCE